MELERFEFVTRSKHETQRMYVSSTGEIEKVLFTFCEQTLRRTTRRKKGTCFKEK